MLEDGSFVALAVDRATGAVKLPLLTSDGKIVRYLPLPSAFQSSPNPSAASLGKASGAASAGIRVSKWSFAPVRHKVLLFATDINQVLEIGQDGITRKSISRFLKVTSSTASSRRMIDGCFMFPARPNGTRQSLVAGACCSAITHCTRWISTMVDSSGS